MTLGGTLIIYNGEKFDYSWREAIVCLKAFCDQVVVLDCGSKDGTAEALQEYADEKTSIVLLDEDLWLAKKDHTKLSYFTNYCKQFLSTDWHFNLQADECVHENCFEFIRQIIETGNAEGYWSRRYNLWGNSSYYLDVSNARKPVGDWVLRLAKIQYDSIDDAQSLHVPTATHAYIDNIRIYHTGFIRDKYKHIEKVEYMLTKIFTYGETDKRVAAMTNGYEPLSLFGLEDMKPIIERLPKFIWGWCFNRDLINNINIPINENVGEQGANQAP